MKHISIFNHVLGPVMRGPSSSHTAGGFHIACMARSLLGDKPRRTVFAFDPAGSYAQTYAPQGADRGFAMGLMNKPLTDESFFTALAGAAQSGLEIRFEVRPLRNPIPLDETIDAVYAVGQAMPTELRCTSKGGLAVTPSALALKPGCCGKGCCS